MRIEPKNNYKIFSCHEMPISYNKIICLALSILTSAALIYLGLSLWASIGIGVFVGIIGYKFISYYNNKENIEDNVEIELIPLNLNEIYGKST